MNSIDKDLKQKNETIKILEENMKGFKKKIWYEETFPRMTQNPYIVKKKKKCMAKKEKETLKGKLKDKQ